MKSQCGGAILFALVLCGLPWGALAESPQGSATGLLSDECRELLHKGTLTAEEEARCLQDYRQRTATFEVVVSADRVQEPLAKVPASVAVVPALRMERSQASSIAEALRDVAGVEVSDAGEPGLARIRIRGEDAKRVTVLIDGQEFFDPRDFGTPILIAPEMVERIEVVRGPASVVYGSRAVGGVVNIITKKGGYHPVQVAAGAQYDSSHEGMREFASVFGRVEGAEYRLSIAGTDADNRESARGEVDPSGFANRDVSAYLGHEMGSHSAALQYQNYDARSDVYVEPEVRTRPPFLDFQLEAPQRDREKVAFFYDYDGEGDLFHAAHLDIFRQLNIRELNTRSRTLVEAPVSFISDTDIETFSHTQGWGGNSFVDIRPLDTIGLLVGVQWSHDDLRQTRDRRVAIRDQIVTTESVVDQATSSVLAGYSRARWEFQPEWELSLGGRLSRSESELDGTTRQGLEVRELDDSAFIGSAALRYSGFTDTSVWFKVAEGYQFPALNQSATGAFAGPSFVNPNPGLNPETSLEYELGARYQGELAEVGFAAFYVDADDYIDHVLCSATVAPCIQPASSRDRVYVNIDSARTWGAELSADLLLGEWSPYVVATAIRRSEKRLGERTIDTGLAPFSGRVGLRYEQDYSESLGIWSDLYVRGEARSEERESAELLTNPGWATLNFSAGVDLGVKRHYRVAIEFSNIFDKYYSTATENLPAAGSAVLARVSAQL